MLLKRSLKKSKVYTSHLTKIKFFSALQIENQKET